jgi:hypothetical protein
MRSLVALRQAAQYLARSSSLAFALGGIKTLSAARSGASLLAFLAGAVLGSRIDIRHSDWTQSRRLKRAGCRTLRPIIEPAAIRIAILGWFSVSDSDV